MLHVKRERKSDPHGRPWSLLGPAQIYQEDTVRVLDAQSQGDMIIRDVFWLDFSLTLCFCSRRARQLLEHFLHGTRESGEHQGGVERKGGEYKAGVFIALLRVVTDVPVLLSAGGLSNPREML